MKYLIYLILFFYYGIIYSIDNFALVRCYDLKTNEYVYDIRYNIQYLKGKLISTHLEYLHPTTKEIIVTKNYIYNNQYPFTPEYNVFDNRFGLELIGKYTPDQKAMNVSFKRNTTSIPDTDIFPIVPNTVMDGSIHFYILSLWDKLMKGNIHEFYFYIPTKLTSYNCKMYKIKEDTDTVTFVIHIANPILHLFSGDLESVYSKKTKRLLTYKGLGDVFDKNAQKSLVVMKFDYPASFRAVK